MEFNHKPVLFTETIESLAIRPEGVYIDGTMGGGGHSEAILQRLTSGKLLSIDQDPDAIEAAGRRLSHYPNSLITSVDGILLDIGVSSYQLDTPERGFSYHSEAPLDMRMSKEGPTAGDLVNTLSQQELAGIIYRYGEDRNAGRIARGICEAREKEPVSTTFQLAEIVKSSVPAAVRREQGHPARKTFQALRIAVNGELDRLQEGLEAGFSILKPGGRLAVITFHSLEDRIVKQQMAKWCEGCICPKDFPVCVCGRTPQGRLIYKKGLAPSQREVEENPRARSSRLRVIEKLETNL